MVDDSARKAILEILSAMELLSNKITNIEERLKRIEKNRRLNFSKVTGDTKWMN